VTLLFFLLTRVYCKVDETKGRVTLTSLDLVMPEIVLGTTEFASEEGIARRKTKRASGIGAFLWCHADEDSLSSAASLRQKERKGAADSESAVNAVRLRW